MCDAKRAGSVLLLLLTMTSASVSWAREKSDDTNPSENRLQNGYFLQDFDDPALPIRVLVPRSAAVQNRNEALSWYMVGRLFDTSHRGEPRKSLNAFRKAVELDPESIEIYRELVPLEFAAKDVEAAVRHAAKAAELDPEDHEILRMLAIQAASSGQLPEAIKHLEQAMKSSRVKKESLEYVLLNVSLGKLYLVTGKKEQAADCYEILLDALKSPKKYEIEGRSKSQLTSDPSNSFENIGQVLLDSNRYSKAMEAFELAAKSSRVAAVNLNFYRAKILLLSDKPDEALTELDKYVESKRTSKGRQPYQLLAEIFVKLNRSDELIQRLKTMVENDPDNPHLQFFLADRLAEINDLEQARSIYDSVLRKGGDALGYAGLARVLRKMQRSGELLEVLGQGFSWGKEALNTLEPEVKAITEDKALMKSMIDEGRSRSKDGKLTFEEAYLLAKLSAALKDPDVSGEFFRLALSLNRKADRPNVLIQMEMAEMFLKLKKYPQAIEAYNEILAVRQLNEVGQGMALSSLAQALAYDNRTEEALQTIAKAIALDDDKAGFRFYEAWIYSHAKRWDEAIEKFDQLMKDFPEEKQIILISQFSLSNVYVQKGEMQKGEEILEKVLEVNPESSQANNDLGYLWADQGKNLERAYGMIRKALESEPDNPAYLDSLGWVLFKLGKFDEAIPPLEQATHESTSGDGTIWDHLGDVYLKALRVEKAVEAWKMSLKHLEEDRSADSQLVERVKEKLKLHNTSNEAKPADKDSP